MTQHMLPEQADEDRRTMQRLATVVGLFFVATAVMAIAVGVIMG